MSPAEWKRERMSSLRARIRIEEAILLSLRMELEEMRWLNRRATELRYGWEVALAAHERERREAEEQYVEIWMAGQHNLKTKSAAA